MKGIQVLFTSFRECRGQYRALVIAILGLFLLSGCILPPPLQYWEIINKEGKVVYKPPHPTEWPPQYELGIISFEKNGKTGYRDRQGRIIIPPIYDETYYWDGQIAAYNGRQRIDFNQHGIKVAPVKHIERDFDMQLIEKRLAAKGLKTSQNTPTDDGQLVVFWGEKEGLYDVKTDKITVQPKFEILYPFSQKGLAAARINGLWGLINKAGVFVIPPQFKGLNGLPPFRYEGEELIGIYQDGVWGFINTQAEFVIKPQFSDIRPFSDGVAPACQYVSWGFINTRGEFIVRPQFYDIDDFSEGLAAVKQNGLWGFVNTQGKLVIRARFSDIRPFSEGVAAVKQNGLWGFINNQDEFVIRPQFSDIPTFSDGAAAVKQAMPTDNRNWFEKLGGINEPPKPLYGYIDKNGKFITPPIYVEAKPFKKGLAAVSVGVVKRQKSK